jgi:hypothetical protein
MMTDLLCKHLVLPWYHHLKGLAEQRIEGLRETALLNLGVLDYLVQGHQSESSHFILFGDCLVK